MQFNIFIIIKIHNQLNTLYTFPRAEHFKKQLMVEYHSCLIKHWCVSLKQAKLKMVLTIIFELSQELLTALEKLNYPGHSKLGQSIKCNEWLRDDELTNRPLSPWKKLFQLTFLECDQNTNVQYNWKWAEVTINHFFEAADEWCL